MRPGPAPVEDRSLLAGAGVHRDGLVLTVAVVDEDRRFLEGRGVERRAGVREVVLHEDDLWPHHARLPAEPLRQHLVHRLLPLPGVAVAGPHVGQVPAVGDHVHISERDARGVEAELDGQPGRLVRRVLLAVDPPLLGERHARAVTGDEAGGRVVPADGWAVEPQHPARHVLLRLFRGTATGPIGPTDVTLATTSADSGPEDRAEERWAKRWTTRWMTR